MTHDEFDELKKDAEIISHMVVKCLQKSSDMYSSKRTIMLAISTQVLINSSIDDSIEDYVKDSFNNEKEREKFYNFREHIKSICVKCVIDDPDQIG